MLKLSWKGVEALVNRKMPPKGTFKYVYGVPRGGIPVAVMYAQKLDLILLEQLPDPISDPQDEYYVNPNEILVVDDIMDSGATAKRYEDYSFLPLWDKATQGNEWVEFPWERMVSESPAEDSVIRMLQYIGEDPNREGLEETPKRVIKAWDHIFSGYKTDIKSLVKVFDRCGYDQIVLLKDIEMYSMCEHHLLPFIGKVHVAYIPDKKVIGVSKLARIVDAFARRVQIQERIGEQVTSILMEELGAKGAACVIEAKHLCMQMRGVEKQHSTMVTSSLKGVFLEDSKAREELMQLIK